MYTDPIAALVRAYAFRFCADPELLQRACVDHTCRSAFGDDEDDDEESEQTGNEPTKVAAGIHKSFAHQPEPDFNLDYSHADHDVGALASALGRARFGRLCLYGPPGTGKTAYARHLARHLGMPLLEKKASDLLDAFVGQTEQNLAAAFLQAHKENAILLIDEADSFLMDRNQAQMRWETSGHSLRKAGVRKTRPPCACGWERLYSRSWSIHCYRQNKLGKLPESD
jgi:hypothetical protein